MTTLEASIGCLPEKLWFYIVKLMHLRWAIFVSEFKHAKPLRKIFTIFLGLLALGVFAGCYLLTAAFLRLLDSPFITESGVNPGAFIDAIPVLIVSGAFLGILLTSFGVLLQALYLANDMDFLMTTPIPIRAVFLTKLLQAILPNFFLATLLGLPAMFNLGAAGGYHALYYPLVFVVLAFLSLAAAGISALLVMAVVRFIPAKHVAEILALVGVIFFFILSQWSNLTGNKLGSVSPEQISKGSQALSTLNNAWSPLAWGGRGLVDLGEGRWLSGTLFIALTLGLSGGVFWVALNAAERLFYTGWASIQVETQRKKNRRMVVPRQKSNPRANIFMYILPCEVRAMMLKDFQILRRDLRNMSTMVSPFILGIVYTVLLLRSGGESPAGKGNAPVLFTDLIRSARVYGSLGIAGFVGLVLVIRLALISFSMEGKSYWIIRTSPISAGKQLAAKFLIAYIPPLIISWGFMVAIALLQRVTPFTILYGLPSVALILVGLVGILLAFGVRGTNLNWTDPRQMANGVSDYVGTIIGVVYFLITVLLFIVPPIGLPLFGASESTGQLIGLLAGGLIALLCTILPLVMVKDRVYRIGEG